MCFIYVSIYLFSCHPQQISASNTGMFIDFRNNVLFKVFSLSWGVVLKHSDLLHQGVYLLGFVNHFLNIGHRSPIRNTFFFSFKVMAVQEKMVSSTKSMKRKECTQLALRHLILSMNAMMIAWKELLELELEGKIKKQVFPHFLCALLSVDFVNWFCTRKFLVYWTTAMSRESSKQDYQSLWN